MLNAAGEVGIKKPDTMFTALYNHTLRAPSFRFHHHSNYEFYVIVQGNIKICIENMLFESAPMSMFIFPPNYLHGLVSQDDHSAYERMYFHVPPEFLSLLSVPGYSVTEVLDTIVKQSRLLYTLRPEQVQRLFGIIQSIDALSRTEGTPFTALKQYALLLEAVVLMMDVINSQMALSSNLEYQRHPFLSVVLSYINDHYTEDLSLDSIAAYSNISKYYLSHEFKRLTNNTIMSYVINKRVQYSHTLLINGVKPLEACYRSGFSSYSNFQKSFRAYFGVSPRYYKDVGGQ